MGREDHNAPISQPYLEELHSPGALPLEFLSWFGGMVSALARTSFFSFWCDVFRHDLLHMWRGWSGLWGEAVGS